MGRIIADPEFLKVIDDLCQKSDILKDMVDEVLQNSDLTVHFANNDFSYYEKRNIVLGLKVGRGGNGDLASEFVMELCNAFYDFRGNKPSKDDFSSAKNYAEAVERYEYCSVKQYVRIFGQLSIADSLLGQFDRFSQAFDPNGYNWGEIQNYLDFQESSGHTAKIASHFSQASVGNNAVSND